MKNLIVALGLVITSHMAWAETSAVMSDAPPVDVSGPVGGLLISSTVTPEAVHEIMYPAGRTADRARSERLERAGRLSRSEVAAEVKAN